MHEITIGVVVRVRLRPQPPKGGVHAIQRQHAVWPEQLPAPQSGSGAGLGIVSLRLGHRAGVRACSLGLKSGLGSGKSGLGKSGLVKSGLGLGLGLGACSLAHSCRNEVPACRAKRRLRMQGQTETKEAGPGGD